VVFKLVIPLDSVQKIIYDLMEKLYIAAVQVDDILLWRILGIDLEIRGNIERIKDQNCLIISNHCSWMDILLVQHMFCRNTPMIKFLVKKGLIYIPVLGWICWAYEFPLIPRGRSVDSSEGKIIANKKLQRDLTTTKRFPASLVNFVEGTRFTAEKKNFQKSEFTNLLTPRTGGLHSIFKIFGNDISVIYDVTITYEDQSITFFDFLGGRSKKIIVTMDTMSRNSEDFPSENERSNREALGEWVLRRWHRKDAIIDALKLEDCSLKSYAENDI